jgi:hypothetical protein
VKPYVSKKRKRKNGRGFDPAAEAQQLWMMLTQQSWSTLALVPGHEGGSALNVAYEVAEVGRAYLRRPLELLCAEGIEMAGATGWLRDAHDGVVTRVPGDRLAKAELFRRLVVIEPVVTNPDGIAIARAADAVMIVVQKGVTDLAAVRWTLEAIGRPTCIGCALVSPP